MENKSIVITEKDGNYEIQNNGISEFALLGILECIVFEMKSAKTGNNREPIPAVKEAPVNKVETGKSQNSPEAISAESSAPPSIAAPNAPTTDIRKRIANAVKAITDLGGQVPVFDADKATDDELHEELAVLTEQYKRLKSSKAAKK